MGETSRWPGSVYGVGEEPDPRFSLANERTFLAWIRTALALLAGAVAVHALTVQHLAPVTRSGLSLLLAVLSLAAAVQAWRGWSRGERAMRTGEPLPDNRFGVIVVAALVVAAVIVAHAVITGD